MRVDWTWTGDSLPSKKNSKKIIQVKRFIKGRMKLVPMLMPSDEYIEWEKGFIRDIKTLEPIDRFKSGVFTFSSPTLGEWDLSNKWESIADAMVAAGYLIDDSWKYCPDIRFKYGGKTPDKKWLVVAEMEI